MSCRAGFRLLPLVSLVFFACGDRVLGGTADRDGGVGACATYVKGTLLQPGVPTTVYCAEALRVCGPTTASPAIYLSAADCEMKYGAASESGKACSAGSVCEVAATGTWADCERAAFGCAR